MSTDQIAENWRVVLENDYYEVSDLGRVRRRAATPRCNAARLMKPQLDRSGYPRVMLGRDGLQAFRPIHTLVAEAFICPRPAGREVNHIDANKENNTPQNLEWVTPKQNDNHARRLGIKKNPPGEQSANHKITNELAVRMHQMRREGVLVSDIAQATGVSRGCVGHVLDGSRWSHLGIPPQPKRRVVPLNTKLNIMAARGGGSSAYKVAASLGVSYTYVYQLWSGKRGKTIGACP